MTYTDATTKKAVAAKVEVQKDAELVTTGEGAKLGAVVKAADATGTAFTVAQGSTEVSDLKNASGGQYSSSMLASLKLPRTPL